MSGAVRTLWTAAWFVVLVLLHYTLRPMLAWRVQADFLVIALLLIAVRARPAIAAFCGFALGVATDSLAPGAFGAGALAMTLVGFASSWLKSMFFAENLALNAIFVLLGKWAFDLVYVLAEHRLGGTDLLAQLFWWSPLSAALTAAVGVGVLIVSRPPAAGKRR
jgi:rod shape-determining protein MreD